MISLSTLLALIKVQASFATLAAAIINYTMAERAMQYEITRELGTLACEIENRKVLKQDCSALQRQYEQLAALL